MRPAPHTAVGRRIRLPDRAWLAAPSGMSLSVAAGGSGTGEGHSRLCRPGHLREAVTGSAPVAVAIAQGEDGVSCTSRAAPTAPARSPSAVTRISSGGSSANRWGAVSASTRRTNGSPSPSVSPPPSSTPCTSSRLQAEAMAVPSARAASSTSSAASASPAAKPSASTSVVSRARPRRAWIAGSSVALPASTAVRTARSASDAVQTAAQHHRTAHAGAGEHRQQAVEAPAGAGPVLGQGGDVDVVLEPHHRRVDHGRRTTVAGRGRHRAAQQGPGLVDDHALDLGPSKVDPRCVSRHGADTGPRAEAPSTEAPSTVVPEVGTAEGGILLKVDGQIPSAVDAQVGPCTIPTHGSRSAPIASAGPDPNQRRQQPQHAITRRDVIMASATADETMERTDLAAHAVDVVKVFGEGPTAVRALDGVSVDFPSGRFSAIMGPSGSGKSTFMHCLAGLDKVTSGQVFIGGTELNSPSDKQLTLLRRERVGFVFQAFNLLPTLTAART